MIHYTPTHTCPACGTSVKMSLLYIEDYAIPLFLICTSCEQWEHRFPTAHKFRVVADAYLDTDQGKSLLPPDLYLRREEKPPSQEDVA